MSEPHQPHDATDLNPKNILSTVKSVLVIDWPSKEVPELLAHAGLQVVVQGGPGPEDYSAYEVNDGQIGVRRIGHPPQHADLVYCYRPFSELPGIIALAKTLHARIIWSQSGLLDGGKKDARGCWLPSPELQRVRELAQSAGLIHISEPCIGDVARQIRDSLRK